MFKKSIGSYITALLLSSMILSLTACGSSNVAGEMTDQNNSVNNENTASDDNKSDTSSGESTEKGTDENTSGGSTTAGENDAKESGSDDKSEGTFADYMSDAKKKASKKTDDKSGSTSEDDEEIEGEPGIVELTDHFIFMLGDASKADYTDIRYYVVDDFDNDGKFEGFFYVGAEADPDFGECQGAVWFVNESGTKKLHEASFYVSGDNELFSIIEVSDMGAGKKFVAFDDAYATELVTNLYYVNGTKCMESDASGVGNAVKDEKTDDLIITVSAYDGYCDYAAGSTEPMWSGHTWKPYYFFYDAKSGDFSQYGAQNITPEMLKQTVGKDVVAEIEKEGYTLEQIIKRDNGIININYSKATDNKDGSTSIEYKNATYDERTKEFLDVWGEGKNGVFTSDYGGIYKLLLP